MGNTFNTNIRWFGYQMKLRESEIFVYAQVGAWGPLIERCVFQPHDAYFKDNFRNTALHMACRIQPPIDAVQALLRAYPAAAWTTTTDGMTPLHFACFCGASVDVIKLLIDSCNESVYIIDNKGRSPLHCSCAGLRSNDKHEILKALLVIDPGMAQVSDNMGRTPILMIADDYSEEIEEFLRIDRSGGDIDTIHKLQRKSECEAIEECFWCLKMLLMATLYGNVSNLQPFRLLHASIGVSFCPSEIIHLAIKMNPKEIKQQDEDGNLPLHIACCATSSTRPVDASPNILKILLEHYPMGARIGNREGKLPLTLAIENGKLWKDGIKIILEAFPPALADVEVNYKCYHLILERIARDCSPTVLYEVIKAKPEIFAESLFHQTQTCKAKSLCCGEYGVHGVYEKNNPKFKIGTHELLVQ